MHAIFCIVQQEVDVKQLVDQMNDAHGSLSFTMEFENDRKLSFLDV